MISVYQLKSKFQDLLRPTSDFLADIGVTANMVTISAFVLSVLTGLAVYFYVPVCKYVYWLLPLILFVRMALNAIDGMLAREHNQKSNIGAIYNELGDILSDIAIYVPLFYVCGLCTKLIFMFTVLTIISETVGIMGIQINASRHYEGPMGKSDRAFWLGVLSILLMYAPISSNILVIYVGIIILLLLYTIYNRINAALKEAANK